MYGVMHPSVFATLDSSPEIPARQLLSGQTPPLGQLPKPSMVGEAVSKTAHGGWSDWSAWSEWPAGGHP